MAEEVGHAFVSIVPSLRGFSADLKRQLRGELAGIDSVVNQAGQQAGHTYGNAMANGLSNGIARIGSLLKTGLLVGTTAAVAGLGALTGFGLKSAAALEQTQIGLEALIGNAVDAKKFLGELQDFAAKTPFEFQGVADASRRILAFGTSVGIAREQVIPTLTTIGDLVSVLGGSQENIDSVVRALGQMASKGKVSQEEILQLAEALPGFNAIAAIASQLGLSVADTLDLITAGGVDAKTGIDALLAGMAAFPGAAGAMAKQAETLKGVFSTFKDTIAIALTNAFQPVIPAIKQSLLDITPVFGGVLNELAPQLGQLLAAILPLVGVLTQALTPVLVPILAKLAEAITQIMGKADLVGLGVALGEVADAFLPLVPLLADVGAQIITAIIPGIHEWVPLLPPLVKSMTDLLIAVTPLIPLLTDLTVFFAQTSAPGIMLLTGAIEQFTAIFTFLRDLDIGGIWNSVTSAISSGLATAVAFVQALPGRIGAFLSGLPEQLANLAKEAFDRFAFAVGFGIGTIIRFFIDLPDNVAALVTSLWTRVRDLFTSGVEETKNNTVSGFNRFLDFVRGLPGQVIGALSALPGQLVAFGSNLASQMYSIGRDIVTGAINGIKSAIGGLISTLKDGFSNAVAGVKRGLGIASPSKVFAAIGEDSIAGYVKGVQDSAMSAQAAALGALTPAAATPGASAVPASRTVTVESSDPIVNLVITHLREAVRTTYGGDVEFAFGSAS